MKKSSLALLITVFIWGTTYVVTKSALDDIRPLTLTFLRFIIALTVLLPLAWREGFRFPDALRGEMILFGLSGVAIFFGFQNVALVYTSSSNAAMILASVPAVTTALAVLVLKEQINPLQWLGIALALSGVILVSLPGATISAQPLAWLGNLLLAGCALAWGFYTIQSRSLSSCFPALTLSVGSMISGLFILTPFTLREIIISGLPHISLVSAGILLYLGLGASGLTFFLWNYALQNVQASQVAPFMNLIPLVGLAMSLLAGETLNWWQWTGGAMAMLGVWLNSYFARRQS